jgi:threonine dehydrogenase-like Zn-dependent dehydrogenase
VNGICSTDVKMYAKPAISAPVIMGHENVGVIASADHIVDVQCEDPLERIMEITAGKGVVLGCTAGAGVTPVLLGIDVLERRAGTLLVQGELAAFPDFPLKKPTEKAITVKSARGHSYRAVELALEQLASRRFPLERLTTHEFALHDVDRAIGAVGGEVEDGVIHVSLLPWKDGPR